MRSDGRVTDEQQPDPISSDSPTPDGDAPHEAATATPGVSRRKMLLWGGAGLVGVAAIGAGAGVVAYYASQNTQPKNTTQGGPGGQMPQGYGSRMPRGDRSGMPSGARPSGARTRGAFPSGGPGGGASGAPTAQPTDQPT
jgi:hypothetical protein